MTTGRHSVTVGGNPMPKNRAFLRIAVLISGLLVSFLPAALRAESVFVTIGSGDLTGVYFPVGLTLSKRINAKRSVYGIRASAESTKGSVFNLNAVAAGHLEFGLAQSDIQHQAVSGTGAWATKGPLKDLRAVFSLHSESVCLVAAADSGIRSRADLKGKKVNLGNPGSGQHQNAVDALRAAGLDPKRDIIPETVPAADAPILLQDRRIDAFFCTVGHPSKTLRNAVSGGLKVRFIPIVGPGIDALLLRRPYYRKMTVPIRRFYPGAEGPDTVDTFGVIATLCTASEVSDFVVYAVTREVFDSLETFKREHPALTDLTRSGMLEGLSAPLHPGAMRYYRETGLMR